MQIDMTRLRETFFAEAAELMAALEAILLRLDGSDENAEVLHDIFRCAHSIKGGAATFQFADLVRFTHGLESLLDQMRSGAIPRHPGAGGIVAASERYADGPVAVGKPGPTGPPPRWSSFSPNLADRV